MSIDQVKKGRLAVESIDFQPSFLMKELVVTLTELKKVNKKDLADHELTAALSKTIAHHTGLKITVSIDDYQPCVEIPAVNRNNVLVNSITRNAVSSTDGVAMINKAGDAIRGTVSLAKAKVTGIFCDIGTTMHMPFDMFTSAKYTPEELAAIMLHECGHIFTYFEFMARTVTTNQILSGLSKALDGSGDIAQREAILVTVKKAANLKDLDTKTLAKSRENSAVEVVVVSNIIKETESELGANVCDMSTWEYLSDEFATRQGAGRHLITALEKVYRSQWNISFRSTPGYLAMEALKIALMILPVIIPPAGSVLNLAILLIAMDSAGDGSYDRPGARFKRVRNQIVENLKDKKLSADDVKRLKEDLDIIDNILKTVDDKRQLVGILWDVFSLSARRANNQLKIQQQMEDYAHNELFVKAAELRTFA